MRRTLLSGFIASLFLSVQTLAKVSFVLVGDSTTHNGTTLNAGGWANGFCASVTSDTVCIDTAHNGATTGTFVANGYFNISLDAIRAEAAQGRRTLVTVQFGHNDQKIADPESMGQNLTEMAAQIINAGGEPVLVTPLTRRSFNDNGTIADTLQPWADETKLIASQNHYHLLDLHAHSMKYCEAIGPDAAHRLNRSPDDNTHLNENGTTVFGRMVADLMELSYPLQIPYVPNLWLSLNITLGISSY